MDNLPVRDSLTPAGPWIATKALEAAIDSERRKERDRVLWRVGGVTSALLGGGFALVCYIWPPSKLPVSSAQSDDQLCAYQVPADATIADLAALSAHSTKEVVAENLPLVCIASNGNFFFREGEIVKLRMKSCPVQQIRQVSMPVCRRRARSH